MHDKNKENNIIPDEEMILRPKKLSREKVGEVKRQKLSREIGEK